MSDATAQLKDEEKQLSRLSILEARVDALVDAGNKKSPAFSLKEPSQLIAIAAFIISLATTVASAYRTHVQDISARKAELRSTLLQLNAGYIQAAELGVEYKNDPALANISSNIHSNNVVTAKQAYAVLQELGNSASSVDYDLVAVALRNVNELALAEQLALKSLETASNFTEYVGAARLLGTLKMVRGQIAEADKYTDKALHAFDKYPASAINEQYVRYHDAYTYLYIASASNDCIHVNRYLNEANKYFDSRSESVWPDLVPLRNKMASICSAPEPLQTNSPSPLIQKLPQFQIR